MKRGRSSAPGKSEIRTDVLSPLFWCAVFFCVFILHPVQSFSGFYGMDSACFALLTLLWAASLRRRLNGAPRLFLTLLAESLTLLYIIRGIRYDHLAPDAVTALRYLWYLYYVPLLSAMLCTFLAALSLRVREKPLKRITAVLFLLTAFLMLMVLTNDLHQGVFRFRLPVNEMRGDSGTYTYGPLFWIINGYTYLLLFSAYGIVLYSFLKNYAAYAGTSLRERLDAGSRVRYAVSALALLLHIAYSLRYIRHGALYLWLFSIQLHDAAFLAALLFWEPLLYTDGLFRKEDFSDRHLLQEELLMLRDSRLEEDMVAKEEARVRGDEAAYDARSFLYERIRLEVEPYLARIAALLEIAGKKPAVSPVEDALSAENDGPASADTDGAPFRARLMHATLLGTFVKRTANLMLLAGENDRCSSGELYLSCQETMESYRLTGAPGDVAQDTEKEVRAEDICAVYGLFCGMLEAVCASHPGVMVRIRVKDEAGLLLRMTLDGTQKTVLGSVRGLIKEDSTVTADIREEDDMTCVEIRCAA